MMAEDVTLNDGRASEGEDAQPYARLVDVGAFGNIDGDGGEDAAVFLAERSGDEEQLTSLVAVINDEGDADVEATVELGANIAIRSVEIDDEEIVVTAFPTESVDEAVQARRPRSHDGTSWTGEGLELTDEATEPTEMRLPQDFEYNPEQLPPNRAETATVSRSLGARGIAPFVIGGAKGQRLELSLASANDSAVLSIQGLSDESQPVLFRDYATSFDGELPSTQDYAVNVISVLGSELDVEIQYELAQPPATPTPAPTPIAPPRQQQSWLRRCHRCSRGAGGRGCRPGGDISGGCVLHPRSRSAAWHSGDIAGRRRGLGGEPGRADGDGERDQGRRDGLRDGKRRATGSAGQ